MYRKPYPAKYFALITFVFGMYLWNFRNTWQAFLSGDYALGVVITLLMLIGLLILLVTSRLYRQDFSLTTPNGRNFGLFSYEVWPESIIVPQPNSLY